MIAFNAGLIEAITVGFELSKSLDGRLMANTQLYTYFKEGSHSQ